MSAQLAEARSVIDRLPPTLRAQVGALIVSEAVRDKSYQATPIGQKVARYLRWKRNEWGARETTIDAYELTLYRLALDHAHLDLDDFAPPVGTEQIREFLDRHWADASANTRAKNVAILRDFFRWAYETLDTPNPMLKIRSPRRRDTDRQAHHRGKLIQLVQAQPSRRDRIAIQLMARLGLRRSELQAVRFRHFDFAASSLTVYGKGGTIQPVPLVFDDLRHEIELYVRDLELTSQRPLEQHLLFAHKRGRVGSWPNYRIETLWEDRYRPLSLAGMQKWWRRCLEQADMEPFPMHELRHSAGTDFYRATGDIKLTQMLLRHKNPSTTAAIYVHLNQNDLAQKLRALPSWEPS